MAAKAKEKTVRRRVGLIERLWALICLAFGLSISLAFVSVAAFYLALWIGGQVLILPQGATAEVTRQLNALMSRGELRIGEIGIAIGDNHVPTLVVGNLDLRDASGGAAGSVRRVTADLKPAAILRGQAGISNLGFDGAQMTVRRGVDGGFSVDFGGGGQADGTTTSFSGALDNLDRSLQKSALAAIENISIEGLTVILEDARSGRIWQAANARSVVRKTNDALSMTLASDVFNGTDTLGEVQISADFDRTDRSTSLSIRVRDVSARDVAVQTPALSWLGLLDAPISGAVRAGFDGDGRLASLAGTLDMSEGVLQPTPAAQPVPFRSAAVYFDVEPAAQRVRFSNIEVAADTFSISASGTTDLTEFDGPWPGAFIGQMQVEEAAYTSDGMFAEPFIVQRGAADFRLRLDPFTLEVGQAWVDASDAMAHTQGQISADESGWSVLLDFESEKLSANRLISSWPVILAPAVRGWLSRNIEAGQLEDLAAALRVVPGQSPVLGFSFAFEDANVSFLPEQPPVEAAGGTANLVQDRLTIRLDEGHLTGTDGRDLDAGGTIFTIPDIRQKPVRAELELLGVGPLETALGLLDRPPFNILSKIGRSPSIANGMATARALVNFPIKRGLQPDDVDYDVIARVYDVGSDELAPGRRLTADALDVSVTPSQLKITGPARLDGVPLLADWDQPLGSGSEPGAIEGSLQVTPARLQQLGIVLPRGLVSGETTANWTLSFPENADPRLTVTSDLRGAVLDLGAVGWRKGRNTAGSLELIVDLGEQPVVQRVSVTAPGLNAEGRIDLTDEGLFRAAIFNRVRLAGFLDAPVRISPGRRGVTNIEINGGRFDLRELETSRDGGNGGVVQLSYNLDEAIISDGLVLSSARGSLTTANGVEGTFQGVLNRESPVEGRLFPFGERTAVQMTSDDAGQTMRAAGIMKNMYGGNLTLNLVPRGADTYQGEFEIDRIVMRDAPVMAELLDALSIVGMFDALNGPGLVFERADGRFLLTEDELVLERSAATGGSLGVSLDGTYNIKDKRLDMAGVVSPVYFLNAIGQIFTRRGEGLFGFSYRLRGPSSDPSVSVNPLSILTPGMFREIFRRAPPDVKEQG